MRAVVFTLLISLTVIVAAQTAPAGNVDKGKELFLKQNCYYCHGTAGQGSRDGARLAATALTADGLIRYVRKPAGAMPAYTEKLITDQDLRDIHAFLKSLPAAKAPKDIPLLEQSRDK
jgi:ubiquinol-cytochrome c reductase cytochrome c subunit